MSTTTDRKVRTAKSDPMFYAFALGALRAIRERHEQWQRDADEHRRNGHRPQRCEHGTPMWVEYDAMCPGCEASLTPHEEALIWAHNDSANLQRILDLISPILAARGGDTAPGYVNDALTRWLLAAMPDAVYPATA